MCAVFEAEHLFTRRLVALKTLLPEFAHSPDARERLLREASVLGTVRHPNVVTIHDAGVTAEGVPYVALDKLDGWSLDSILKVQGRLEVGDAIHVVHRAACAVGAAHRVGVLHRDVKPSNVMIAHEPGLFGPEAVRLVDFGIASVLPAPGRTPLTATGTMIGTPEYLAPEQLLGAPATTASDLYALGLVLHETLLGALPFASNGPERLLRVLSEDVPDVRAARQDVSAKVAAVLAKALARDPELRFPSADAFAAALGDSGEMSAKLHLLHHPPALPARRRRHVRAAYVAPLRVEANGHSFEGRTADLSAGGALCFLREHVQVGATIRLRMPSPVSGRLADFDVLVRWARHSERADRLPVCAGVELLEAPSWLRHEIDVYVAKLGVPM